MARYRISSTFTRLLLSISVLCLALFTPSRFRSQTTSAPTTEAKRHYQNAAAAIDKSDWETAKNELLLAEKLAPRNALIRYDLALAFSQLGQADLAESEINRALELGLPTQQKISAERLKHQLENPPQKNMADSEPSLSVEDTIKYINEKLAAFPPLAFAQSRCTKPQSLLSLNSDRRYLTLVSRSAYTNGECDQTVYTINIAYLGKTSSQSSFLCNGSFNSQGEASLISFCGRDGTVSSSLGVYSGIGMHFAGPEEQGKRIGRAVVHLTTMLQAEGENQLDPKDPFAK